MVVHDNASFQFLGDRASLFPGAIEGVGQARCRVQPLQLAGDAIAGLVEMANLRRGDALADALVDRLEFFILLAHPADDAGRTDRRRAEQIAQRLRGPVLGNELLDVQIDRRRPDALAVLRRRDHARGEYRLRHASASCATVDRGLMFGHQQRALGKIEHLTLFDRNRRIRPQRQTAMLADAGRMGNHKIGFGDLPQGAALVALLPAAHLARTAAQASGQARLLLQTVARRRFGAVRTVQSQAPKGLGQCSFELGYPAVLRGNQLHDFGRKVHSAVDSDSTFAVYPILLSKRVFNAPVANRTYPGLGVNVRSKATKQ